MKITWHVSSILQACCSVSTCVCVFPCYLPTFTQEPRYCFYHGVTTWILAKTTSWWRYSVVVAVFHNTGALLSCFLKHMIYQQNLWVDLGWQFYCGWTTGSINGLSNKTFPGMSKDSEWHQSIVITVHEAWISWRPQGICSLVKRKQKPNSLYTHPVRTLFACFVSAGPGWSSTP
jgi:hypothetical protein